MSREPRIRLIEDNRVAGVVWEDTNGDLVLEEADSGESVRVGSLGTAVSKLNADTIEANSTNTLSLASTLDAQNNNLNNIGGANIDNLSVNDWEWIDVREAGLGATDDAGDFIRNNIAEDTLLIFPPGTYHFDTPGQIHGVDNCGLWAPAGGAVFTQRNISPTDYLVSLGERADPRKGLVVKGLETDTQNSGFISTNSGCVVEDITYLKEKTLSDSGFNLSVEVPDPKLTAVIRNIDMLQGGIDQGLADESNEAGGIYMAADHAGTAIYENLKIGGFPNNGLYGSGPGGSTGNGGKVIVKDSYFENSGVANVRIGGDGSTIKDTTISLNTAKTNFPTQRALYLRQGSGHTVENVNIEVSIPGTTLIAQTGACGTVQYNGLKVDNNADGTTVIDLSPQDGTDPKPVSMNGWEVTGTGAQTSGYAFYMQRDNCYAENWNVNLPNHAGFWLDSTTNFKIEDSYINCGVHALLDQGTKNRYDNVTFVGGTSYGTRPVVNGTGQEAAGAGNPPAATNWETGERVENTDDNTIWLKSTAGTMVPLG